VPTPSVLIALPTYGSEVNINFAFSLLATTRILSESGVEYETLHIASSHITRARNVFANYFLGHPRFTHLLFLDTDMKFRPEAIMRLLGANRHIAGIASPFRRIDLDRRIEPADHGLTMREWLEKHADYNLSIRPNDHGTTPVSGGFVEVDHVGTGIFLARRDTFEMTRPHTKRYKAPHHYRAMLPDDDFRAFFDTIEEDGVYLSEDLSFCRRARLAGCSIAALVDETIVHYGDLEISGQYLRSLQRHGRTRPYSG
jgi:hypothetical protein